MDLLKLDNSFYLENTDLVNALDCYEDGWDQKKTSRVWGGSY